MLINLLVMKNLSKLLIVFCIVIMGTKSFCQTFGLKAGLNLSNMLTKDNEGISNENLKMNPGFHVGATVEFPLAEMFSFESGLLLSTKGVKIEYNESGVDAMSKMNLLYLDIPLTAKAYFDISGAKIYGVFGPYLGIGLSGKTIIEATYQGRTETEKADIKWGSDKDNDELKRLDYGLMIGAGVEIKAIQIGLSYSLGLANISAYTGEGTKISNRVLGLSVGYRFGVK